MIPAFLIKPLIYASILTALCGISFYKGVSYSENKYEAAQVIQAKRNAKLVQSAITETENKTSALYEDTIKRLKKRKPLPDTCVLSADFRMRHDEAVGMPESPSAQTVAVATVADTVESNYDRCRQNIIWLEECQRVCK